MADSKATTIAKAESQLAHAAICLLESAKQVDDEFTPSDFIVAALAKPAAALREAQRTL